MKKRFGTCTKDCYGGCLLEGIWDDGESIQKLQKAIALKDHPFTQGVFCPKFSNREKLLYHEKRLKHTMVRQEPKPSNHFTPIDHEEAIGQFIRKLDENISKFGASSILYAGYSGNQAVLATKYPHRFYSALGATITGGGICNEGGCAGLQQIFGTYTTTNPFQIVSPQCRLIVVWNSDLTENNNHAFLLVKKAMKNGAKLIVVDSRTTKLAKTANLHIRPHPLTEYLIAILVIQSLIKNKQIDQQFVDSNTSGFDVILERLTQIDKENFFKKYDSSPEEIDSFSLMLRKYRHHTIFMVGYGLQKDFFGGKMIQSIALLQILLGNIGKPGTGLIYSQSDYRRALKSEMKEIIMPPELAKKQTIVDMIELAAELESGKYKMLIISGFNPANSLPNQARLRHAFLRKDLYIVSLEAFLTETTRYADLIFPVKYDLETHDLLFSYYIPGVSQIDAGPCPYPDCKSHVEFYNDLASKINAKFPDLGFPIGLFQKNGPQLVEDMLLRGGSDVHKAVVNSGYYLFHSEDEVFFSTLKFPTPDSKINLSPVRWVFDEKIRHQHKGRVINAPKPPYNSPFQLLTPNHPRLLHSQLIELNPQFEADFGKIYISPEELKRLNFKPGEPIEVFNKYYASEMIVDVSDQLSGKTAIIYSGGPDRDPNLPNANHFTPDRPEILANSGSFNSAIVYLKKKSAE